MSFKILNYSGLKTLSTFIKANRNKAVENSTAISDLGEDVQNLAGQVAAGFEEVETNLNTLDEAVGNKAAQTDLDSHTGNTTVHITSTERTNWDDANSKKHEHSNKTVLDGITSALINAWNAAKTHADSAHAPSGAEVNQNAFAIFVVGNTQIVADAKSDTLTLVGSNVTLTPDTTNDMLTIGLTKANVVAALGYTPPTSDTVYTHPSSGVTAGSYGDSAAQTPAYGETFEVPYITVDENGHVTGISVHTVKIPASDNVDTKNTAGSSNTSSKIFLVGATSQAANPQTYSHDTAYVGTDGHLYSDSKQVVNLSGSQALTNKTYNGYTLAAACAREVATLTEARSYLGIS